MKRGNSLKEIKYVILLALMISQALVLSFIESLLPLSVPIPGVKLGLTNIVTLAVIILFGMGEAVLVVFIRTLLASLFGGGLYAFLFSVTGGILSAIIMALLYRNTFFRLSITGISVAGGISHNVGQLLVACLTMKSTEVLYYTPVLMISGVITGLCIGICSANVIKLLNKHICMIKFR